MESRKLTSADIPMCLTEFPEIAPGLGRQSARIVLSDLANQPAFAGVIVERRRSGHATQLIACAASVFVRDQFAVDELGNPHPGITERILRSHLNGQSVVLTRDEIGSMNGSIGLSDVTIWSRWRESESRESVDQVQIEFKKWYVRLRRGQFLRRMMFEIRDERDLHMAAATGSSKILAFDGHNRNRQPRGLAFIDRSTAPHMPTTATGRLFNQFAPELGLRFEDQELLLALMEEDLLDEELAPKLKISVAAVKRRWAALYGRIERQRPSFFNNGRKDATTAPRQSQPGSQPGRDGNSRGAEKRRKVLRYVDDHPEELRPFQSLSKPLRSYSR